MTSTIIPFDAKHRDAFYDLNIWWFEKYFSIEEAQKEMLRNPEDTILADGGEVYFALEDGRAVGTVAMKTYGDGIYELTKLGVDPNIHGGGHGRRLCETVIEEYKKRGGIRLFLETHTKLTAAMALYKKLGFVLAENPLGDVYAGTDCYMEWQPEEASNSSERGA